MSLYRNLLACVVLALLGALLWDWLVTDPGQLILRLRGQTITTSVAFALVAWAALWFSLWSLVWLLRLPLRAWRRHQRSRARNRFVTGLEALQEGRFKRAGELLEHAAEDISVRSAALLAARKAADARQDEVASARLLTQLSTHDAPAAALDQAQRHLAQGRADAAFAALASLTEKPSPAAAALFIDAAMALGRAADATPMLALLRRESDLPSEALAQLETRHSAAVIREAAHADALISRWQALAAPLQDQADVVTAMAQRASTLGLDDAACDALINALNRHWQPELLSHLAALPTRSGDRRLAACEDWLAEHPNSAPLLLALGRLCLSQQLWGKADDYLYRALAQGGGGDVWEQLGALHTAQGDSARAQLAFANALRVNRGESALTTSGRSLREQIADHAVAELRNEHGLPHLPG